MPLVNWTRTLKEDPVTLKPVPFVVKESGTEQEAPSGAVPIALFGAGGSTPEPGGSFPELTGTVEGLSGANLQELLESVVARLAELEEGINAASSFGGSLVE